MTAKCPRSPDFGEPVPMAECIDNGKCVCGPAEQRPSKEKGDPTGYLDALAGIADGSRDPRDYDPRNLAKFSIEKIKALQRQVDELSIHAEKWVQRALGGTERRTVDLTDEQRRMLTARGVDEIPSHDESQCWEPCGELGKSAEHARLAHEPAVSRGIGGTNCIYGNPDCNCCSPQPPRDGQ